MSQKDKYVSKMPKQMIIILMEKLISRVISKLHLLSLNKTLSKEELREEMTEVFHNSENLMHLLVAKHLCKEVANWPDEIDLLEEEMEAFKLFWASDLGKAENIVANAEMDIFLHSVGISRNDGDAGDA